MLDSFGDQGGRLTETGISVRGKVRAHTSPVIEYENTSGKPVENALAQMVSENELKIPHCPTC